MVESRTAERERRQKPFGAPHVFVLAVVDGDDPTAVHRITQSETLIGRGERAHFVVNDEEVSKQHVKIRVEGSVCTLQDLDSLNGTYVNGSQMRPGASCRLRHLDEVQIGNTRLFLITGRSMDRKPGD